MKLYSVRDIKVSSYGRVFSMDDAISAIRDLTTAVLSGESLLSRFPSDFELFELGEVNKTSGKIKVHDSPKFIISCQTILQSQNQKTVQKQEIITKTEV